MVSELCTEAHMRQAATGGDRYRTPDYRIVSCSF